MKKKLRRNNFNILLYITCIFLINKIEQALIDKTLSDLQNIDPESTTEDPAEMLKNEGKKHMLLFQKFKSIFQNSNVICWDFILIKHPDIYTYILNF